MYWQKIQNDRLQRVHSLGFLIIKPEDAVKVVPFFCPVCKGPMRKADDSQYFHQYECCATCGIMYAEGNKDKWEKGWRPDFKEQKKEKP